MPLGYFQWQPEHMVLHSGLFHQKCPSNVTLKSSVFLFPIWTQSLVAGNKDRLLQSDNIAAAPHFSCGVHDEMLIYIILGIIPDITVHDCCPSST